MENRQHSVAVGRILGISIFIHYSWLLIAGLILLSFLGLLQTNHPTLDPPIAVALSALGSALFFGSVLLHELAHAVVANRRGFEVKGITLFLFGGATEADVSSQSAKDEFVVAIVGPLTSLVIGLLLAVGAIVAGRDEPLPELLSYLAAVNVLLAIFNLAPGLPLDGGRVFRSIAWGVTGDFAKATRWATVGGVFIGYLLIAVGFLSLWQGNFAGLWFAAIGWMISQSARQNRYQDQVRSEFGNLVAADIMSSPVIIIPAETSIADSVRDYFAKHIQTSFPVVDGDQICGLLSVSTVRDIPASEIWKTTAGQAARRADQPTIVGRRTPMSDVIKALSNSSEGTARVLVVEDELIVGIVSPSDVLRRHSIADLIEPALAETMRR